MSEKGQNLEYLDLRYNKVGVLPVHGLPKDELRLLRLRGDSQDDQEAH